MYEIKNKMSDEELKDFYEWYIDSPKAFLVKHKSNFPFNSFSNWIRRIDLAHEDVRDFLGDKIVSVKSEIKEGQDPVDWSQFPDVKKEIETNLSDFLERHGLDVNEGFKYPTYALAQHKVTKLSKSITRHYQGTEQELTVQKLISKIGDIWSKHRSKKQDAYVTVSTTPKGFVLLGHYLPDKDSCFREGSDKTEHKYILSQTKDTVVVTISQLDEEKNKQRNIARLFGFIDTETKSFFMTNCYCKKGTQEGDIISILQNSFEKISGCKLKYQEGSIHFDRDRDVIYQNKFGRWDFVSDKHIEYNKPTTNMREIYGSTHCPVLGHSEKDDSNWNFIDDKWCSSKAQESCYQCFISGKFTTKNLPKVKDDNGLDVRVLHKYYGDIPICDMSKEKCISVKTAPDGLKIASYIYDELYEECEATGKICRSEDMIELLGYSVSKQSVENKIYPFTEQEKENIIAIAKNIKESKDSYA